MPKSAWQNIKNNQQGLASIVVVGVLIVLLTVISLGFARIMDRAVRNSLNDHTATAATYAAQSGINDLATYIRSRPNVKSENCRDLIGTSSTPGPFYNASDLSGDRNSEITCILLNQRPDNLAYDNLPALESKVIKVSTDTTPGSVDRFLISWQATDRQKNVRPSSTNFPDVANWNQNNNIPLLRLTLYPVPMDERLDDMQSTSRTIFLYPRSSGDNSVDYSALTDGDIQNVRCNLPVAGFDDSQAPLDCNLAITGLAAVANVNYYYLRIMPIYNSVNLEIRAKDIDDRVVKFRGVQAVLDVTAKVGPASKRLQARVDIGGNPTVDDGPVIPSPNVGASDDAIPDFTSRSANSICKRFLYEDSPYEYVTLEGISTSSCISNSAIETPAPAINYFRINGINDTDPTPALPYTGVYYLPASGTAPLTWATADATSCTGERGAGAWAGNKNGQMSWSGPSATGSQSIPGISSVAFFDLRCQGPGGATSTRTTVAWPPPTATFAGTDTSYRAGQNFNIRFSSTNSSRCEMTSSGNFSWNATYSGISNTGGSSPTDSRSFPSSIYDQSAKSFTVTCNDPSGRSVSLTWTVCLSGCNTTILPPSGPDFCPVSWDISDNGNGTGTLIWSGDCPRGSSSSGYYRFTDCNPNLAALTNSCGDVGESRNTIVGVGEYCGNYWGGFDPWGWINNDGPKCRTVSMPPVVITAFSVGDLVWYEPRPPECWNVPDGAGHTWYICSIGVSASQAGTPSNEIRCTLYTNGANVGTFGSNVWGYGGGMNNFRQLGWYGNLSTGPNPPAYRPYTVTWTCASDRGGASDTRSISRWPSFP